MKTAIKQAIEALELMNKFGWSADECYSCGSYFNTKESKAVKKALTALRKHMEYGKSRAKKGRHEMKLNQIHDNPPKGVNFTAYYYDGSGARLFHWTKEGQIVDVRDEYICEGDEVQDWLCDADYGWWTELPADFQFWYMKKDPAI